jgi:hypothetical protein
MMGLLPLMRGRVIKTYKVRGAPYCDIRREGLGAKDLERVPVMVLGGGRGRTLSIPPAAQSVTARGEVVPGALAIIGFFGNRSAVVLGTVTDDGAEGFLEEPPEDREGNADVGQEVDIDTAAIIWDGAQFSGRGGDLALRPAAGKVVSAEVSAGGALRVSNSGEAEDWAVLARALVAELAPLYAKVNEQDAQIADLTLKLTTVAASLTPSRPPPKTYVASNVSVPAVAAVAAKVLRVSGEAAG